MFLFVSATTFMWLVTTKGLVANEWLLGAMRRIRISRKLGQPKHIPLGVTLEQTAKPHLLYTLLRKKEILESSFFPTSIYLSVVESDRMGSERIKWDRIG